jgi:hypothetical protein
MDDQPESPLTIHVRKLLEERRAWKQIRRAALRDHERRGFHIIDGGRIPGADGKWQITDWRTSKVLANDTTHASYNDALTHKMIQFDTISNGCWDEPLTPTPDVDERLSDALNDWVHDSSTPDDAIAAAAGWTVEATRAVRSELTPDDLDDDLDEPPAQPEATDE